MEIWDLLALPFMRRALLGLVAAGAAFPVLGVLVVNLNLQVIRFALMHVGLLGGAVALVFGASPLVGGLAGIGAASFLLGPIGDRTRLDIPAAAGLIMTGSLAGAFALFYKTGVPAMEAFNLFAGSVLMLNPADVGLTVCLGVVILAAAVRWYRDLQVILFDRHLAVILGVPERSLRYALLTLVGLAVGVAMRLVGALLVDALFLLPAMGGLRLGRNLAQAFLWSSALGVITAASGVALSVLVDLPIGASVACCGVVVVGLAYAAAPWVHRLIRRKGVVQVDHA